MVLVLVELSDIFVVQDDFRSLGQNQLMGFKKPRVPATSIYMGLEQPGEFSCLTLVVCAMTLTETIEITQEIPFSGQCHWLSTALVLCPSAMSVDYM